MINHIFYQNRPVNERLLLTDCVIADVVNLRILPGASVLIENGMIRQISSGGDIISNARRISLHGKTLTPGLIDSHVHLCLSSLWGCHLDLDRQNAEQRVRIVRENLRLNLQAGVTTVRDLGSPIEMLAELQRLEQCGEVFPSVIASGPVLTVKDGHAAFIGVITSKKNCAKLIHTAAGQGAGVVKIIGTGGNLSPSTDTHSCQFSDSTFSYITETARRAGMSVACHAHAAAAVRQCLNFGVRSIEHGSYLDQTMLPGFLNTGAFWVPTICPGRLVHGLTDAAKERVSLRRSNVRRAIEMGVAVAAGTDAGVGDVPHGSLAHELDELMDAGMTPLQALHAATLQNAIMLGSERHKGSLEAGKDADLLIFDGDITARRFSFHSPSAVIKAGVVVRDSLSLGHRQDI